MGLEARSVVAWIAAARQGQGRQPTQGICDATTRLVLQGRSDYHMSCGPPGDTQGHACGCNTPHRLTWE